MIACDHCGCQSGITKISVREESRDSHCWNETYGYIDLCDKCKKSLAKKIREVVVKFKLVKVTT